MTRKIMGIPLFSLLTMVTWCLLWPFSGQAVAKAQERLGEAQRQSYTRLAPTNTLYYHGGPVMTGTVTTYAIFWEPTGSYVSPNYNSLILQYFNDVGASPLYHNNRQYYNAKGKYPVGSVPGGSWLDTRPYPASSLQESDIQKEVKRAMRMNGWKPSIHKIFFVFSAKGEIMCSDVYGCTFSSLCAWHNFMGNNTIYAAMPYAGTDLSVCGVHSSPNKDFDADSEINLNTHEQMEAATDPMYSGWYGADRYHNEIGDECVWQFGPKNKYGGDVVWNGHPYMVQYEWDNKSSSCVLKGP